MRIRQANIEDLDRAEYLLHEFEEESLADYGFTIPRSIIEQIFLEQVNTSFLIEHNDKIVGVLIGQLMDNPFNGVKMYREQMWYVSKPYRKYGLKLLKRVEGYCQAEGVKGIIMGLLLNTKSTQLDRVYRKLGYRPIETQYVKTLGGSDGTLA